jgi:transposase
MDHLSKKDKLQLALALLREMEANSPADASPISAARIYHVNERTVKTAWYRERKKGSTSTSSSVQWGGQNKILSDAQHEALIQYARRPRPIE